MSEETRQSLLATLQNQPAFVRSAVAACASNTALGKRKRSNARSVYELSSAALDSWMANLRGGMPAGDAARNNLKPLECQRGHGGASTMDWFGGDEEFRAEETEEYFPSLTLHSLQPELLLMSRPSTAQQWASMDLE